MNNEKIHSITSKLEVDPETVVKYNKRRTLLNKLIYPFIQIGFYIFSVIATFMYTTAVEEGTGITYPYHYYPSARITAIILNGTITSSNLVTSNMLISRSKIELKRRTMGLYVICNFILSVLTFLLIWKYKVTYPVYAEGLTPEYGVYTKDELN